MRRLPQTRFSMSRALRQGTAAVLAATALVGSISLPTVQANTAPVHISQRQGDWDANLQLGQLLNGDNGTALVLQLNLLDKPETSYANAVYQVFANYGNVRQLLYSSSGARLIEAETTARSLPPEIIATETLLAPLPADVPLTEVVLEAVVQIRFDANGQRDRRVSWRQVQRYTRLQQITNLTQGEPLSLSPSSPDSGAPAADCPPGTPTVNREYRGEDLRNVNFRGQTLNYIDFTGANLANANFNQASLQGAILDQTRLENANLNQANLRCASLAGAVLRGTNLNRADLRDADLSGATLINVNLNRADLSGADLSGATLEGVNLSNARLDNTRLPATPASSTPEPAPTAPASPPSAREEVITLSNGYRISFRGVSTSGNTSTWRYTVAELPAAQDLSNWVLELPSCARVVSASPQGERVDPDPNADISGIKWETGAGFTEGEFSVTLSGRLRADVVTVAAKGPDVAYGVITGPSCN